MEDDAIRNLLSPAANQEAESSRSESNSIESGVTADESYGIVDTRLEECTGWTNEKHNSYLGSLETSFVRQLYSLLGGKTCKSFRSDDPPANSYKSTDQFAVQENGCWQKINLGKKRIHLDASCDLYPRENSSTSSFAHPKITEAAVRGNLSLSDEINCCADQAFPRTSVRNPAGKIEYYSCHECSNGSTAESSGQNFKDKDKEDDLSSSPVPKRRKGDAEIDSSISDQVVPLRKASQNDIRSANRVFSVRRTQSFNFQNAGES